MRLAELRSPHRTAFRVRNREKGDRLSEPPAQRLEGLAEPSLEEGILPIPREESLQELVYCDGVFYLEDFPPQNLTDL